MASAVAGLMAEDTLVEPAPAGLTRGGAVRLDAIDMLRGLVIVIMVLDHVRDFFHIDALRFDPTDPIRSNAALFATRWVTHLCATTFVFLAGVSISFLNVSKYPPSPDYVLATLGVSMLLFLALEHLRGPASRVLLTFGRTPLFSYLCHIYFAHGLALAVALAAGYPTSVTTHFVQQEAPSPSGWGFSLATVYLAFVLVLVLLFPLSRWFEGLKRRRRDWWLSYL